MEDVAVTILGNTICHKRGISLDLYFPRVKHCVWHKVNSNRPLNRITQWLKVQSMEPDLPGWYPACSISLALGSWMRCALVIIVVKCR